jgi:hypothetical protein
MSSSSSRQGEEFPFVLRADSDAVRITVFDGLGRSVAQGHGQLALRLPRGLYTVRAELGGHFEQEVLRHDGPTDHPVKGPDRYSAIPLARARTSRDYYVQACAEWSRKYTTEALLGAGGSGQSHLFLFLHARDEQAARGKDLAAGLSLVDSASGAVVSRFGPHEAQSDPGKGWLAFSAAAVSGLYLLRFTGEVARELPVRLFPRWSTQLFLTYHERPLFEGMRVLLSPLGRGFSPDDPAADAVDLATTGLHNRKDFLPPAVKRALARGEFEDPMIGLIGTHQLLRDPEARPDVIQQIIRRLGEMLSYPADVQALERLAARRFNRRLPLQPFREPPMLRVGLEAVIAASVEKPDLVPENGLIDRVASRRYHDSPWSGWEPGLSEGGGPVPDEPAWIKAQIKLLVKRREDLDREQLQAELAQRLHVTPHNIRRSIQTDVELVSWFGMTPPIPIAFKQTYFPPSAGELADLILRHLPEGDLWSVPGAKDEFKSAIALAYPGLRLACVLGDTHLFCEELARLVQVVLRCVNDGVLRAFNAATAILALSGLHPLRQPEEQSQGRLSGDLFGKFSTIAQTQDPHRIDHLAKFLFTNFN